MQKAYFTNIVYLQHSYWIGSIGQESKLELREVKIS